jgi:hypothetical protein
VSDIDAEFLDAYNEELGQIGCRARVGPLADEWHMGSMQLFDKNGSPLGIIPQTVDAMELPAIVAIVEKAYQRGLRDGRKLTTPDGA